MNKVRKIVVILLVTILFGSTVVAADNQTYTYEFDNITIMFSADTVFNQTERLDIVNHFLNDEDYITTNGLACIFGHNFQVDDVTTITHRVRTTQPRCLESYYELSCCTRCGYYESEFLYSIYITCCL